MAVLWAALLAGMLGRQGWVLDLFAHFRPQYGALFFAIALVSLARRHAALAFASMAGAVLAMVPVVQHLGLLSISAQAVGSPTTGAQDMAAPFRLVTYNTWLRQRDHTSLAEYLESADADTIVLQEIGHAQADALHTRLSSYPYAYTEPGLDGAVVFSRWPILEARTVRLGEKGTPAAWVVIRWRDVDTTVLGVHLHWPLGGRSARLRNQELAHVAAYARSVTGPLLVAGDFNTTPWSSHFQDMIRASGLGNCAAGRAIAGSWPAQFMPLGIAIDHCLASHHWRSLNVRTGPRLGSDHLPVVADLMLLQ